MTDEEASDRLSSWKEIAAYLGRTVRTVQRWERLEGLPVERLLHDKRGSVYASRRKIDQWWASRAAAPIADPTPASSAPAPTGPPQQAVPAQIGPRLARRRLFARWESVAAIALVAVAVLTIESRRAPARGPLDALQRGTACRRAVPVLYLILRF